VVQAITTWWTIRIVRSRTCGSSSRAPDFPTGGIIYGRDGIKECYEKGRGRIVLRARAVAEETKSTGKQHLVVSEFPYQVSPERVHEQIRDLVLAKKLEGSRMSGTSPTARGSGSSSS